MLRGLYVSVMFGIVLFGGYAHVSYAADTTPPVTTVERLGTSGQNDWFRSNINVTLTATDTESGPSQTTYWVDSDPPTIVAHEVFPVSQFLNASFEEGSFWSATSWSPGTNDGFALYYTSRSSPYEGKKDVAIAAVGSGQFFHWTNESNAVLFPEGAEVRIGAQVKALLFDWNSAYFEVWGQFADGNGDVLLGTSANFYGTTWPWMQATVDVVVPSDTPYMYLKLGGNINPGGIVYWDNITVTPIAAGQAITQFTFSTDGSHILNYFSTDNNGNSETQKNTSLKIDTVAPNPWQNFYSSRSSCDHCYITTVEIRDITSGVDVSTAQFHYYTDHQLLLWSDWLSVDSVQKTSNGQDASDGETEFVTLMTPEINFGDSSSGPFKVQYRVTDIAGNLGTSPVYQIVAPWLKAEVGSIYVGGEISLANPPFSQPNASADVFAGQTIEMVVNATGWTQGNYDHAQNGYSTLESFYPYYSSLYQTASPLPNGKLPIVNGVYKYAGNYDINTQALQSGFASADVSSVVIIDGDVTISKEFTRGAQNFTIFFVNGDVEVDKQVENIAGIYIIDGRFISDSSGHANKKLTVSGAIVVLDGFSFSRDLGDNGLVNNLTDPGELIVWQPAFLFDPDIIQLVTGNKDRYIWQEIEK